MRFRSKRKSSLGWLRDFPDYRDCTDISDRIPVKLKEKGQEKSIKAMLSQLNHDVKSLKAQVDLREFFSPIENQEELGSCTAHAGVGLVEYFERRAFAKHIDASRLFLYKTTRNLMRQTGDTGAFIRSAMGAMVLFGVPPEEFWPYNVEDFDKEPTAFCYAFAQNFQTINYYRLDSPGTSGPELLKKIKSGLNKGLPAMFGFTVYSSIEQAWESGRIPYPVDNESIDGGHAVIAAGYDDNIKIKNPFKNSAESSGAILIRNSWGTQWGEDGYGWLPYDYILNGLAVDWWSAIKSEWVDTGNFG